MDYLGSHEIVSFEYAFGLPNMVTYTSNKSYAFSPLEDLDTLVNC